MTVKALAVVVRSVKLDLVRLRGSAQILDVNMVQTANLCANAAVQSVIGVAGVAGFIGRNTMILKVSGGCVWGSST